MTRSGVERRQHNKQDIIKKKGKGMVLYSAVSSPLDRSKRFTLSSPDRPVHSDTVLGFSWKQLYRRPPDDGTSQGRRRVNATYVLVKLVHPGLQCLQAEDLPKLLVHKLGHLGVKVSQYQTRTCPCQRFPR